MQPRPMADTSRLLFPSLRFCIISPSTFGTRLRRYVWPLFFANRAEDPIAFPTRLNRNSRFIFFPRGFLKDQEVLSCMPVYCQCLEIVFFLANFSTLHNAPLPFNYGNLS